MEPEKKSRRGRPPTAQPRIEAEFGKPLEDLLYEWRFVEQLTVPQIKERCRVSLPTVNEWLTRFGYRWQYGQRIPPPRRVAPS